MSERSIDFSKNVPLIYGLNGVWSFMVLMPIIVPFFQSRGLTMSEIYQLQAVFGVALLILEVPSGYFSDVFGRKNSLYAASVFHGLGYTSFLYAHDFFTLAVAEVILAIAVSLFSGTDVSLIYDSLEASGNKKAPIKMVGKKVFYLQTGETLGGLVGGWLLLISFGTPLLVQAVVAWLPLVVVYFIKEPPRLLMDRRRHRENVIHVYKSLFKHSKLLNYILLTSMFYGVATLVAVWAFQKYWQHLEIPLLYFGYLWALSNFSVAIMGRYAHKLEKHIGSSITVIMMAALPVVGYFGISAVESIWGIIFCLCFQLSRGINAVVIRDALNKRVTADLRATANSVSSLGVRGLFILLGPVAGHLIDTYGIRATFFGFGIAYVICFFVIILPLLGQRAHFIGAVRK